MAKNKNNEQVSCGQCGKMVSAKGLINHIRLMHTPKASDISDKATDVVAENFPVTIEDKKVIALEPEMVNTVQEVESIQEPIEEVLKTEPTQEVIPEVLKVEPAKEAVVETINKTSYQHSENKFRHKYK